MTIEEKRLQLLEDTVYYYSIFPRCMNYDEEGDYMYPVFSGDTARLNTAGDVLGRLMTPQKRTMLDLEYGEVPLEDIWDTLPEEFLDLGKDFLTELCCLHDNCSFWEGKTLSEYGKEFVEEIKEKFCL